MTAATTSGIRLRVDPSSAFYLPGPTAVGKTVLAVEIAERCGGEIVGADAFQVYRGLDLLTAKPAPGLRARVPHHLIGEIPLTESWDVAQWRAAAIERISSIRARGGVAIVVGGTGLYLRALTRGLADLPPASPELRAQFAAESLDALQRRLAELDPVGARQIDLQNPRRVIRALEVSLLTGRPYSSFREQWKSPAATLPGALLLRPREELYSRIDQRTAAMFAAGVVDEVREAGEIGPTASQTLGLREIRAHLAGAMTREVCLEAIRVATRQYAKRQLTWFRQENALRVLDLSTVADSANLIDELAQEAAKLK